MIQEIQQLFDWSSHASEIAAAGAALVAIAKLVWSFVGWLLRAANFYLSRKTMRYQISFGPIDNVPKSIEGVYCQIVRYGTDLYIEKMASDQERYEGRLQNKVLRLATQRDKKRMLVVHFQLQVHKRIGTQFKTFVRVRDPNELQAVEKFLTGLSFLSNVDASQYLNPPKVSFTINMFPIVESVEGIKNNFFYPV